MPNGDHYKGETLDEIPNGRGIMSYSETGDKYEGLWAEGRRKGYGIIKYANGDTFSGEWLHDLKSGDGTYEFADGRVLSGLWRNDRAEGETQ
jgi:hypothetical protein